MHAVFETLISLKAEQIALLVILLAPRQNSPCLLFAGCVQRFRPVRARRFIRDQLSKPEILRRAIQERHDFRNDD